MQLSKTEARSKGGLQAIAVKGRQWPLKPACIPKLVFQFPNVFFPNDSAWYKLLS